MTAPTESPNTLVVPLRELNHPSKIAERVEAGMIVVVTKNGRPIMRIEPYSALHPPVYPFRTDPMGPIEIPELDLPALSDEEIDATLQGMGDIDD